MSLVLSLDEMIGDFVIVSTSCAVVAHDGLGGLVFDDSVGNTDLVCGSEDSADVLAGFCWFFPDKALNVMILLGAIC